MENTAPVIELFECFATTTPGLEKSLFNEIKLKNYKEPRYSLGGVTFKGTWHDLWRANLELRGANQILVRIGSFRVFHLAQLDKRARKFPWTDFLPSKTKLKIEATCRKSKIYHEKAVVERISKALTEDHAMIIDHSSDIKVKIRIEDDLCTISLDSSGVPLHKRGYKLDIGKAPMRETLASLFLQECGFKGDEALLDPMCGSGTFVIEAAEIALQHLPGRNRPFAFEQFSSFDQERFDQIKKSFKPIESQFKFYGSDRDQGAVERSLKNADRANVSSCTVFEHKPISEIIPPCEAPGLVMINPPYGARIGNRKLLFALYSTLGKTLKERFSGWRVGLITNESSLAHATELPFSITSPPILHGSIRINLYQTDRLP